MGGNGALVSVFAPTTSILVCLALAVCVCAFVCVCVVYPPLGLLRTALLPFSAYGFNGLASTRLWCLCLNLNGTSVS